MRHTGSKGAKGLSLFAVTCISVITLLSIIGVGYGYWQNGIEVTNSISTGNMKVDISDCKVYEKKDKGSNDEKDKNSGSALPSVKLNFDNKKMNVDIKDAHPGYAIAIQYKITNNGTIPAKCRLVSTYNVDEKNNIKSADDPLLLKASDKSMMTLGVGKSVDGIMIININNVSNGQNYSFPINLVFDQYNELD